MTPNNTKITPIADHTVRQIRDTLTVQAVCEYMGAELRKVGTTEYKTFCPTHDDNNPSLMVSTAKNCATCFVCTDHKGRPQTWDALGLLRTMTGADFNTTLHTAAQICHICIDEQGGNQYRPTKWASTPTPKPTPKPTAASYDYFAADIVAQSVRHNANNGLYAHLCELFGEEETAEAFALYGIGGANKWGGSVVFWQYDTAGRARHGKVMKYHSNGKRAKAETPGAPDYVTWADKCLHLVGNYKQTLWGAHLLERADFADMPVNICESEKTAIMRYLYDKSKGKRTLWCATGGANAESRLTAPDVLPHLAKHTVRLHPDNDMADKWAELCARLNAQGVRATIDTTLQAVTAQIAGAEKWDWGDVIDYLHASPSAPTKQTPPPPTATDQRHAIEQTPPPPTATDWESVKDWARRWLQDPTETPPPDLVDAMEQYISDIFCNFAPSEAQKSAPNAPNARSGTIYRQAS